MAVYQLGSGCSPHTKSARIFVLEFPAFRTGRNRFLLFTSHPVYGFLLLQSEWTKTTHFTALTLVNHHHFYNGMFHLIFLLYSMATWSLWLRLTPGLLYYFHSTLIHSTSTKRMSRLPLHNLAVMGSWCHCNWQHKCWIIVPGTEGPSDRRNLRNIRTKGEMKKGSKPMKVMKTYILVCDEDLSFCTKLDPFSITSPFVHT